MTREEIIDSLEIYTVGRLNKDRVHITVEELQKLIEAIKTLEQESSGDAISRQYLLDNCVVDKVTMPYVPVSKIQKAPPVNPQQKIGKWIKHDTGHSIYYDCSLCSCIAPCTETADSWLWKLSNYCPDCGAKMKNHSRVEDKR